MVSITLLIEFFVLMQCRCIRARNEEMLRKLGVSPYTGLQKDAFHPLRFVFKQE